MQQRLRLLVEGVGHRGVAVAEAGDGEAREEVEVLACRRLSHSHAALAPHELEAGRPVGGHQRAVLERRGAHGVGVGVVTRSLLAGDHGADAGVGEQLEQDDVGQAAVEDVGRADAVGRRPARQASIFGIMPPVSDPSSTRRLDRVARRSA